MYGRTIRFTERPSELGFRYPNGRPSPGIRALLRTNTWKQMFVRRLFRIQSVRRLGSSGYLSNGRPSTTTGSVCVGEEERGVLRSEKHGKQNCVNYRDTGESVRVLSR